MKSLLKEYFEKVVLTEKMLTSEVTFGFELEAFIGKKILKTYDGKTFEDKILNLMDQYYVPGGDITYDDTIFAPIKENVFAFEYRSPPLSFTINNIQKFKSFLLSLNELGIKTNNSCGFHIHFGFPKLDKNLNKWVVLNLAMDHSIRDTFNYLGNIKFFHVIYADEKSLNDIESRVKLIGNEITNIDTDKYTTFNLHAQGTLEWRGPRNFIDNKEKIVAFVAHVYKFVLWMTKVVSKKDPIHYKDFNGDDKILTFNELFAKEYFPKQKEWVIKTEQQLEKYISYLDRKPEAINKKVSLYVPKININREPSFWIKLLNSINTITGFLRFHALVDSKFVNIKFPEDTYRKYVDLVMEYRDYLKSSSRNELPISIVGHILSNTTYTIPTDDLKTLIKYFGSSLESDINFAPFIWKNAPTQLPEKSRIMISNIIKRYPDAVEPDFKASFKEKYPEYL